MPLDPQARQFLDLMAEVGVLDVSEMTPDEVRAGFASAGAAGSCPDPRADASDRTVPGPLGDIPVRIYRPPGGGQLPVVVFFHGGGWVVGDLESHDGLSQNLAMGVPAVVVSVDYRLAPEHRYPAAVQDAWAATRWVSDHADELGGDADKLAVAGDSAGGNLAAVVAIKARDARGPQVAFQVLIYPATDMTREYPSRAENGEGYLLNTEMMEWFSAHYFGRQEQRSEPDASPMVVEDLTGLAPALVITAEFDPLRDEGEAYADRLRSAGVNTTLSRYDGMIHGFVSMDLVIDGGKRAIGEITDALRSRLA